MSTKKFTICIVIVCVCFATCICAFCINREKKQSNEAIPVFFEMSSFCDDTTNKTDSMTTEKEPTTSSNVKEETKNTTVPKKKISSSSVVIPAKIVHNTDGTVLLGRFKLVAYCSCSKCCGKYANNRPKDENGNDIVYGASGRVLHPNHSVAVDTSVIPYGTRLIINGHEYVADDCGGSIKGKKIDVYFSSHDEACSFGMKYADVYMVV